MAKSKHRAQKDNNMEKGTVLVIGDLHFPYHHVDTFRFLEAVNKKYNPGSVICIGDIVDHHALSQFEHDPDLDSTGRELEKSQKNIRELAAIFKKMIVLLGNHDIRPYKRAAGAGISMQYMKQNFGEILGAPKEWIFKRQHVITDKKGRDTLLRHDFGSSGIGQVAIENGCNVVQGHLHTHATIEYRANHYMLVWGMNVGCSVDDDSLSFNYNKTSSSTSKRRKPILSHGLIVNGHPRLLPMILNKHGRWNGELS